MDRLKEQLKKHYNKTELPEGLRQKLLTLEVPEPTPVPVRVNRKRLLTPIAAMLMAAVAILGGGKYLMDAMPPTAVPPTAVVPVESAGDFEDVAPTDMASDPEPDIMSAAPADPEPGSIVEPAPEKTAPEQNCPGVTTPQSPTPTAPSTPAPPPDDVIDPMPPIESAGPEDDPTPPPDDVPPYDSGEDDPPTNPGVDAPTDPSDDPVKPPDDPVVPPIEIPNIPFPPGYKPGDGETPARPSGEPEPPDDPIDPPDSSFTDKGEPSAKPLLPPEITGRYVKENGQHMVYLTNCDTGETCALNLTSTVTADGYFNIHRMFDCLILIYLRDANPPMYPSTSTAPSAPPKPDISEIDFEFEMEVICVIPR